MSTEPKMALDTVEKLKLLLGDAPRDHDFLTRYVGELEHHRLEDDTFRRLAFENVSAGGAYGSHDRVVTSVYSEMYEPLSPEQKTALRRWWHGKIRNEAGAITDLRTRLSKLA